MILKKGINIPTESYFEAFCKGKNKTGKMSKGELKPPLGFKRFNYGLCTKSMTI